MTAALNSRLNAQKFKKGVEDKPPCGHSANGPHSSSLRRKVVWGWNDIFALNHNIFCERSNGRVRTTTNNTEPIMESNQTTAKAERLLWHFDSGP